MANDSTSSLRRNSLHETSSPSPSPSSANGHDIEENNNSLSQGAGSNGNPKIKRKRAAKACRNCRTRKVRCDVVDKLQNIHMIPGQGIKCTNCHMDNIECVINPNGRGRRNRSIATTQALSNSTELPSPWGSGSTEIPNARSDRRRSSVVSTTDVFDAPHTSHSIYQNASMNLNGFARRQDSFAAVSITDPLALLRSASIVGDLKRTEIDPRSTFEPFDTPTLQPKHRLPGYLNPLPGRMTSSDIDYLFSKSALSVPQQSVRNAILRSYVEYVHPSLPVIDLHDLLRIINDETGAMGKTSLLLLQAIMFAGAAFVDVEHLKAAGFVNRKVARKAFFQRARLLYDFDYETDRISILQSLILMAYWFETPNDVKDAWHWMGVAITLAYSLGLHRNTENSRLEPRTKKLWKRIWWSCFIRDREVALGMRKPIRVKEEDFDVPMLIEEDFELQPLTQDNNIIPESCTMIRDIGVQRQLAQMCIAKARLCICTGHVLNAQYSTLVRHKEQAEQTPPSVMLIPNKMNRTDEIQKCGIELDYWKIQLPTACHYSSEQAAGNSGPSIFVHRAMLHMIYYATEAALYRPQMFISRPLPLSNDLMVLQTLSQRKVRTASNSITQIVRDLHSLDLVKYLPTSGVTVLFPTVLNYLMYMRSGEEDVRQEAKQGFEACIPVLVRLREIYAAADYKMQLIEAASRGVAAMGVDTSSDNQQMVSPAASNEDIVIDENNHLAKVTGPSKDALRQSWAPFLQEKISSRQNSPPPSPHAPKFAPSVYTPPDEQDIAGFSIPCDETPREEMDNAMDCDFSQFVDFGPIDGMMSIAPDDGDHGESGFLGYDVNMDFLPNVDGVF